MIAIYLKDISIKIVSKNWSKTIHEKDDQVELFNNMIDKFQRLVA
jgi:hypothetical protein